MDSAVVVLAVLLGASLILNGWLGSQAFSRWSYKRQKQREKTVGGSNFSQRRGSSYGRGGRG